MRTHMTLYVLSTLALLTACGPDFDDEKIIEGYRVIGMAAEPPEVPPDGSVMLTVFEHDAQPDRPVSYAWSVCLLSPGALANFECVTPDAQFGLPSTGPQAEIDFGPDGLNLRALFEAAGPIRGPDGTPMTLEDGFDVWVHLESGVDGGRQVSTYKKVVIRDAANLNRNPVVEQITIDDAPSTGVIAPGKTVELAVKIDEASGDRYPDGVEEVNDFEWFTINGTIEDGFGPSGSIIDYTAPKDADSDTVFVVVRDGRGGSTLHTLDLRIEDTPDPEAN